MSSPTRIAAVSGIAVALVLVFGYVIVVALRGHGTHLGDDTIGIVFATVIGLAAASVALYTWDRPYRVVHGVALSFSVVILGMWSYMRFSGRIITYEEMIAIYKGGPNKATPVNTPVAP